MKAANYTIGPETFLEVGRTATAVRPSRAAIRDLTVPERDVSVVASDMTVLEIDDVMVAGHLIVDNDGSMERCCSM